MDYLFQDGGKSKKAKSNTGTKTTKSKTSTKTGDNAKKTSIKKGGNFLGVVGDLVAPTGWETFATTAGLFALDRADAALRRGKSTKNSAKKGGMTGGGGAAAPAPSPANVQALQLIARTGQILSDYNRNYSSLPKGNAQRELYEFDLYESLEEEIDERERLLPLVVDISIKKRLESSIKRLSERLFQEGRRDNRVQRNFQRKHNKTPNANFNFKWPEPDTANVQALRLIDTTGQILSDYNRNYSSLPKGNAQRETYEIDLYKSLEKEIVERERLLPLVVDIIIKKRLESTIKKLSERLFKERRRDNRVQRNFQRKHNKTPNATWN
jgi:hypothetical protein